jgi:hypothetical protein
VQLGRPQNCRHESQKAGGMIRQEIFVLLGFLTLAPLFSSASHLLQNFPFLPFLAVAQ